MILSSSLTFRSILNGNFDILVTCTRALCILFYTKNTKDFLGQNVHYQYSCVTWTLQTNVTWMPKTPRLRTTMCGSHKILIQHYT